MSSFGKYLSRHLLGFAAMILGLALLNALAFGLTFYHTISRDYGAASPRTMLERFPDGGISGGVPEGLAGELARNDIWAMLLAQDGAPAWRYHTPPELPQRFSIGDVAAFTRGYLCDYPVFVRSMSDGLLVLGYPKDSYTKLTGNYYPAKAVRTLPLYATGMLAFDLVFLFAACYVSKGRILRSTGPIISAVETLAEGNPVDLPVRGELSGIAAEVNRASHVIRRQNRARANWIGGVSHDIRTPLSMILGYAERIETDATAAEPIRAEAAIIRQQSIRIKELVQDLNLVSRLEYEMQPPDQKPVRLAKLLRCCAAELLNGGLPGAYTVEVDIPPEAEALTMDGDARLLMRALHNLAQNSIRHNPAGCTVALALAGTPDEIILAVADDGTGLSEETQRRLQDTPHYMESADEKLDLRHGLGLLLVRQITEVHGGKMEIRSAPGHGCEAILTFVRG